MLNKCGIYKITNNITGDFYIGSSVCIKNRLAEHRCRLTNDKHPNIHLQRAWNKYGEHAFEFTTILLCDIVHKIDFEQGFLDLFKPAYNIAVCAAHSGQGMCHTEEARAKMSKARMGKCYSAETRAKMSYAKNGELHHMFGKHHTEETRAKMSATRAGQPNGCLGTHRTEETRAKMSEAQKRRFAEQKRLILPLDNQI